MILRALAHPSRLMIINRLLQRELCVGEVEKELKLRQANISQHLRILRNAGFVAYRREGKKRCYFLVCPRVAEDLLSCIKRSIK